MLRILPSSIQNHSLNAFRGTGDPARRMKTAIPNTTRASRHKGNAPRGNVRQVEVGEA